jgi:fructokinase
MLHPRVICFGEVLWDLLPTGAVAGGAPMNVAFQLNQLGVPVGMISRIGTDQLGKDIHAFLESKHVPTEFIQHDDQHKTGTVQVTLTEAGQPSFKIVEDVAWDYISAETKVLDLLATGQTPFFVFGSLAARTPVTKQALLKCIAAAQHPIFDVNLRAPFYSKELVGELLGLAHCVKMNDDELDIICDWFGIEGGQNERMVHIKSHFEMDRLLVTRGAAGAVTLGDEGFCAHNGYQVQVVDTIGSGDAFLAGYLTQMLNESDEETCLDFGCKLGAYVATQRGGTPEGITTHELSIRN